MGTNLKFALLSMAVASSVGWVGCTGGTEVIGHPDAGSSSGGSTGDGSGGSATSSGGKNGSSSGGTNAGTGGSESGSGGMAATGSGGQPAGSGGSDSSGSGGSATASGGASETGSGGRMASSGGATGSGGSMMGSGGTAGKGGGTGTGSGEMMMSGSGGAPSGPINVLIWNNALAYGHQARTGAIQYLKARESTDNIKFDTTYAHATSTEGPSDTSFDASVFDDTKLAAYDVVFFLDTTGTTIDDNMKDKRRQALQDFIEKKGKGFVGTHSATDTYQGSTWPWYVDFIGANFQNHSNAGTSGTAQFYKNMTHPILMAANTPNPWNRSEEWYTFTRDPLSSKIPGITILLTCHDTSMTQERDTAWVHEMPAPSDGGRAGRLFYTAFGHSTSAFQEKAVMDMIIAGIKWVAYRL